MLTDLAKIEAYIAISEVKARYCRTLDTKDWAGYADVFTEDAELDTRPAGGSLTHGRDAVVSIVRSAVETATTAHQVHSPEITLNGDTADVIWVMQDRVEWGEDRRPIMGNSGHTGYGHYHEQYVRDDGRWRIAKQTLTRLHVDTYDVKAGRGRGRRRSCWALNREHRLVASTVLSVADARRRHGDLDGDVDIGAALREPTGSCAPRSPTTCCMPLECSPATNTPGHGDRRYAAGLSASRPGWPEHNADRSCTCPITGPGRNNGLHSGAT